MSFGSADSKMRDLIEQENWNAAQGAGIQRNNSLDSNSYGNPTLTRQLSGGSQRSAGNQYQESINSPLLATTTTPNPINNINSTNNAYLNRSLSTNYLQPTTTTAQTQINQLGYSGIGSLPVAAPITTSRLQTGQYNHLLSRYPTLDPVVHPIAATTKPAEVGSKSRVITSPVKINQEEIKGTSKIQFIPFEKKIVQYQQHQRVQKVPRKRKIIEYKEQVVADIVPKQVVKQDYYAVEHLKQYIPEYVPERVVVMVEKAVPYKRIQYVPVTRQVFHGAPLGDTCSGVQLPTGTHNFVPGHTNRSVSNAQSFSGVPPFYQNYSGQFFSNAQFVPTYPAHLNNLNKTYSAGSWQQNRGIYGQVSPRRYIQPGGITSTSIRNEFRKNVSRYQDSYETYIPSFKY